MLQAEIKRTRVVESLTLEWILLPVAVGALVFAHFPAIVSMVGQWTRSPMYSYAFTVPFIAGYLVWVRRAELRALQPHGSWRLGAPVLALGAAMSIAARVGSVQLLDQLALLVNLVGAIIALAGWRYVCVAWAGLAYLLLMVPIWDGITESLHKPFQNQSAAIGMWLLRFIGIPAYREGTFIALPNLNIEVARACSGVNYLVAVIALGLPLSYVYLFSNIKRVVLIIAAVIVAALSNGLRVALIGTLAHYQIGSPLHGPFHVLHGLFVAAIGYVALFVGLRWLSTPTGKTATEAPVPPHRVVNVSAARLATVAVILLAVGAMPTTRLTPPVPLASALDTLPATLGRWAAVAGHVGVNDVRHPWNGVDQEIARQYSSAGDVVTVYVGYYENQAQKRELSGSEAVQLHRASRVVHVPFLGDRTFAANVIDGRGPEPTVEIFWYEMEGTTEVNRYRTAGRTTWNALLRARSNGAVVMASMRIAGEAQRPRALEVLEDFAAQLRQAVVRLLPTDVQPS